MRARKATCHRRSGTVVIIFVASLLVLLGFVGMGTETGVWYLVQSELSKAVDAGALAGAKNVSNPFLEVPTFAEEVAYQNFPRGTLGTPPSGGGAVSFTATIGEEGTVKVVGRVNAPLILSPLFGINDVVISSTGVAQKRDVEIMMVLDKSGSMSGEPISDLKNAALSFISFFEETQDTDKMGLITYASAASLDHPVSATFITDMTNRINALASETGKRQYTNAEDALDRANDELDGGLSDQSGLSPAQRVQQFVVFFTDGNPNAFRDVFRHRGTDYDAVAYAAGLWGSCTDQICRSDGNLCDPTTGDALDPPGDLSRIPAFPTGHGSNQVCEDRGLTTRWRLMLDYPVPGHDWEQCGIPESVLKGAWFRNAVRSEAIGHAQELKSKKIKIYTIGLGGNEQINRNFLSQIASGPEYEYYAPDSSQLETLFNRVAKDIKLRLIE